MSPIAPSLHRSLRLCVPVAPRVFTRALPALCALCASVVSLPLSATVTSQTSGVFDWFDPLAWQTAWASGTVYSNGEAALIDGTGGGTNITLSSDSDSVQNFRIGNGGSISIPSIATVNVGGGSSPVTLTVTNIADIGRSNGSFGTINILENGTFTQNTKIMQLGFVANSNGFLNLLGGTVNGYDLDVSVSQETTSSSGGGNGTFTVESGTATFTNIARIGNNSIAGSGNLIVNNGDFNARVIQVGVGSTGRGNVTLNGGTITVTGTSATVFGNGSSAAASGGTGRLFINGGTFNASSGNFIFGIYANDSAFLELGGTGHLTFSGAFEVGRAGSGNVLVTGGCLTVSNNTIYLARSTTGTGTWRQTGGEVKATALIAQLADSFMDISGGNFSLTGAATIRTAASLTVSGGNFTAASLAITAASLTVAANGNLSLTGALSLASATLSFKPASDGSLKALSAGSLSLSGSNSLTVDLSNLPAANAIDIVLIKCSNDPGASVLVAGSSIYNPNFLAVSDTFHWEQIGSEYAYILTLAAIPEPAATVLLLGLLALAALFWVHTKGSSKTTKYPTH